MRLPDPSESISLRTDTHPLGQAPRGFRGVIVSVGHNSNQASEFEIELERRLLEIGFVEGASVELLHQGFIGKDPIAVRVGDMNVALRRRDANAILVRAHVDQTSGTVRDA
jgi:ferrous iron transport protein A